MCFHVRDDGLGGMARSIWYAAHRGNRQPGLRGWGAIACRAGEGAETQGSKGAERPLARARMLNIAWAGLAT